MLRPLTSCFEKTIYVVENKNYKALSDRSVADIFCAVYSVSWCCKPMWTLSVHLAQRSLAWQILFVAVTEAACRTHSLRVVCLKLFKRMDNRKHCAWVTYIQARSCLLNSNLHSFMVICFGVQNECLHASYSFWALSWFAGNNCTSIETYLNCQDCDWKWALVLTFPDTKAQKILILHLCPTPTPSHSTLI